MVDSESQYVPGSNPTDFHTFVPPYWKHSLLSTWCLRMCSLLGNRVFGKKLWNELQNIRIRVCHEDFPPFLKQCAFLKNHTITDVLVSWKSCPSWGMNEFILVDILVSLQGRTWQFLLFHAWGTEPLTSRNWFWIFGPQ